MEFLKRTWAEVSLDNLTYNYHQLRSHVPATTRFLGVVKADAYGHGAVAVSKHLEKLGAEFLAVSNLEEAKQLRDHDVHLPILLLGYTPPQFAEYEADNGVRQEVNAIDYARQLNARLEGTGKQLKIHLKLDTGMSRLGFFAYNRPETIDELVEISKMPNLYIEGVFQHFCVADSHSEECQDFTRVQYGRFTAMLEEMAQHGIEPEIRHCCNSAATILHPEYAMDMIRPGIATYGFAPQPCTEGDMAPRPPLTWRTTLHQIKDFDEGITVTGSGDYDAFDSVTLTASVSDGYDFDGWYDSKGRLLSTSVKYTVPAVTYDTEIYAANTLRYEGKADIDVDGKVSMSAGTDGVWDVIDSDTGTSVYTDSGSVFEYTFVSPGVYLISYHSDGADGCTGSYTTVFVDGTSVKTFSWTDNDKVSYEYSIGIRYSDFVKYREKDVTRAFGSFEHCRQFVTYTDPYIMKIADDFDSMLSGKSDAKRMDVLLTFTQYIKYAYDQDTMGQEEYWKYPLETLFDMNGDCEDTSILFCAIAKAMGYDCAMLLFDGHMAAGITFDGQPTGYSTFDADGKMYLYCETTATGYRVGVIPNNLVHRYTISVI